MGFGGKGGGGGGGSGSFQSATAAQYNPQEVLQQFQKAAQALIGPIGQASLQTAMSNAAAQSAALPFSSSATKALGEFQQWLGITPADTKSEALQQNIRALQNQFGAAGSTLGSKAPDYLNQLDKISNQLANTTDPAMRTTLSTQAQGIINEALKTPIAAQQPTAAAPTAALKPVSAPITRVSAGGMFGRGIQQAEQSSYNGLAKMWADQINAGQTPDWDYGKDSPWAGSDATRAMIKSNLEKQMAERDAAAGAQGAVGASAKDSAEAYRTQLQRLGTDFGAISPDRPLGYTGSELEQKIQATPGYQAQFSQGMQAITRQQAARGDLASGKALTEAQSFGQSLAGTVYQNQLANLGQLAGISMPVTQQGIAQLSSGNQYQTQLGLVPAQAQQQSFMQGGNALLQAGLSNAQLQTQANIANTQASSQLAAAQMQADAQSQASGAGLLGGLVSTGAKFFL